MSQNLHTGTSVSTSTTAATSRTRHRPSWRQAWLSWSSPSSRPCSSAWASSASTSGAGWRRGASRRESTRPRPQGGELRTTTVRLRRDGPRTPMGRRRGDGLRTPKKMAGARTKRRRGRLRRGAKCWSQLNLSIYERLCSSNLARREGRCCCGTQENRRIPNHPPCVFLKCGEGGGSCA